MSCWTVMTAMVLHRVAGVSACVALQQTMARGGNYSGARRRRGGRGRLTERRCRRYTGIAPENAVISWTQTLSPRSASMTNAVADPQASTIAGIPFTTLVQSGGRGWRLDG
jgi:hypothetical protein